MTDRERKWPSVIASCALIYACILWSYSPRYNERSRASPAKMDGGSVATGLPDRYSDCRLGGNARVTYHSTQHCQEFDVKVLVEIAWLKLREYRKCADLIVGKCEGLD